MIALDTSLLVFAHRRRAPQHVRALAMLERLRAATAPWGIPAAVVVEFWSVVTRLAERPATPREAAGFLDDLWRAGAQPLLPQPQFATALVRAARRLGVRGPRIFDLQIALTALANGATERWTHDADFVALPGLRIRDPLASDE